ncbi:hypothetical protein BKP35_10430 [Anaerobacillus arseniciselenatis]|uniref:Uncharacterized protein n=1 Tax=Anaerobacillus arseniciselenatis TaxID=85682 RepID=A0A1S2LMQ7_9BACI|nr:hypothetical protein BKP35_10430 [Anaerobacillus arseniciselenatis]
MKKIKEKLFVLLTSLGAIIFFVLIYTGLSDTIYHAPEHVLVIGDLEYENYIAPFCLNETYEKELFDSGKGFVTTIGEARKLGYEMDSTCTYNELVVSRQTFISFVLENLGFWKHPSERWNEDGTWNW